MTSLFDAIPSFNPAPEIMGDDAVLLRGKALPVETELLAAVQAITAQAPFRQMRTPGGFVMSVAMTNCGTIGWVTDRTGYRYDHRDPDSGLPWPAMPDCFLRLAADAASDASFPDFVPDACLINCYRPGARLSLHKDKDERDYSHPIVSVSLGLPATFQFGGRSRLCYHGVTELKDGEHEAVGRMRINLTFRRAR